VFQLEWRAGLKAINLTEFRLTEACVIADAVPRYDVRCVARPTVRGTKN
jgi:hypothetical protein